MCVCACVRVHAGVYMSVRGRGACVYELVIVFH